MEIKSTKNKNEFWGTSEDTQGRNMKIKVAPEQPH